MLSNPKQILSGCQLSGLVFHLLLIMGRWRFDALVHLRVDAFVRWGVGRFKVEVSIIKDAFRLQHGGLRSERREMGEKCLRYD